MFREKKIWLAVVLVSVMYFAAGSANAVTDLFAASKTYTEEELGIRQEPLSDERETYPAHGEPSSKEPGSSEKFQRSFENSPPLIPHDVTGMLPLARSENICLSCHMPDEAVSMGATPLPKSHFVDLSTGKGSKNTLDGDRYNCMQCHVIQNRISPPIANLFQGEFREEGGRYKSNLINILNEGVTAE